MAADADDAEDEEEHEDDKQHNTSFGFPYSSPYDVQTALMNTLHNTLASASAPTQSTEGQQQSSIAIMESPTGTGKTLTLLCATLAYMKQQLERNTKERECCNAQQQQQQQQQEEEEPSWIVDAANEATTEADTATSSAIQTRAKQKAKARTTKRAAAVAAFKQKENNGKHANQNARDGESDGASAHDDDNDALLDPWDSDDDANRQRRARGRTSSGLSSSSSSDDDDDDDDDDNSNSNTNNKALRLYFCSRTHSQLSQAMGEFARTKYAETFSAAALASRSSLCLHKPVRTLPSALAGEACVDLQETAKKNKNTKKRATTDARVSLSSSSGCPYHSARGERRVRDDALAAPVDIEELAEIGRAHRACPYYGSRMAAAEADVVFLPYQSLLHGPTREALGINLEGAIVIIDEAHNAVDAVNDMHGARITATSLDAAGTAVQAYLKRFGDRLNAGNLRNLHALAAVCTALRRGFPSSSSSSSTTSQPTSMTVNDFLFACSLDHVNLFKLVEYLKESRALRKMAGYGKGVAGAVNPAAARAARGAAAGALHSVCGMLEALTRSDADGRVLRSGDDPPELRYVNLNASMHFERLVAKCHAVVLAGGTLSPVPALLRDLFPTVKQDRVVRFSCGHIVDAGRFQCLALGRGPSGLPLNLEASKRATDDQRDELGRVLRNAVRIVPGGVVCFVPSHRFVGELMSRWRSTGMLAQIEAAKPVLLEESKGGASATEALLAKYTSLCTGDSASKGALLLCVVGGRLSEGVNFGDDLGRLVVVAGLPYPNPTDAELVARMRYLDAAEPGAGRAYYEALCWKAVNQSIGRAIRHRLDYATALLLDARYVDDVGLSSRLPAWVSNSLVRCEGGYGQVHGKLATFFSRFIQ
ncbi:helicase ATP-binding domain-containing protein [Pseudoscourfieldia marina]